MAMRPNSYVSDAQARARRMERYRSAPAAWELAVRPVAYLLIGIVWIALFAAAVGLSLAIPLALTADGPWVASEELGSFDPLIGVLSIVFFAGFIAPLLGYVFLALPLATGPAAVLAVTYAVRGLLPSYRGERLSATGWSRGAIGIVTVLPTALSLMPVRMTRWTAFWAGLYLMGWIPSRRLLLAAFPAGIGNLVTVIWVLWPLHDPAAIAVWIGVSALFAAATVVLVVRDARHRYVGGAEASDGGTPSGRRSGGRRG